MNLNFVNQPFSSIFLPSKKFVAFRFHKKKHVYPHIIINIFPAEKFPVSKGVTFLAETPSKGGLCGSHPVEQVWFGGWTAASRSGTTDSNDQRRCEDSTCYEITGEDGWVRLRDGKKNCHRGYQASEFLWWAWVWLIRWMFFVGGVLHSLMHSKCVYFIERWLKFKGNFSSDTYIFWSGPQVNWKSPSKGRWLHLALMEHCSVVHIWMLVNFPIPTSSKTSNSFGANDSDDFFASWNPMESSKSQGLMWAAKVIKSHGWLKFQRVLFCFLMFCWWV